MLLTVGIAFCLTLAFVPLIIRLGHHKGWFDHFDERKIHKAKIPRLGGAGFAFAWLLAVLVAVVLKIEPEFQWTSLVYMAGIMVLFTVGLVDDFRNLPARIKLFIQIGGAVIILFSGVQVSEVILPWPGLTVKFGFLTPFLTVFWIISITNAINLIDGLDAQAGGISFLAAVGIAVMHVVQGNDSAAILSAALAASIAGFLVFNRPPARIFMGDGGAYFLGGVLATLPFIPQQNPVQAAFQGFLAWFELPGIGPVDAMAGPDPLIVIMILIVPIADMIAAILRRARRRLPFHSADREHVHHKLLDFGLRAPQILWIVLPVALIWVVLAVLAFWLLRSGFFFLSGMIELVSYLLIMVLFLILHGKNKERRIEQSKGQQ